jgi:hypothetical protein
MTGAACNSNREKAQQAQIKEINHKERNEHREP